MATKMQNTLAYSNPDACVTYLTRSGRVILHSCLIADANVPAGGLCNFGRSCRGSCRCDRPARGSPVTNISAALAIQHGQSRQDLLEPFAYVSQVTMFEGSHSASSNRLVAYDDNLCLPSRFVWGLRARMSKGSNHKTFALLGLLTAQGCYHPYPSDSSCRRLL